MFLEARSLRKGGAKVNERGEAHTSDESEDDAKVVDDNKVVDVDSFARYGIAARPIHLPRAVLLLLPIN